ncbi:MAG: hypothetical protein ACTS6A_00330 [Candidatus Hodgkinia cicadicola]
MSDSSNEITKSRWFSSKLHPSQLSIHFIVTTAITQTRLTFTKLQFDWNRIV